MSEMLLRTKLFILPLRPSLVQRPHLMEQLNKGNEDNDPTRFVAHVAKLRALFAQRDSAAALDATEEIEIKERDSAVPPGEKLMTWLPHALQHLNVSSRSALAS